ncbi:MAG TPA: non-homologous end-joining DNA ligase [Ilumatobacteraceae bacterium]|nr:non-homologous end-joining DNA ligase [Ilumatobacteraceae bacterium]
MPAAPPSVRFPTEPMKAVLGTLPVDDANWAYEIKFDGYRTLAFIDGGQLRLQSSSGRDVTADYPELGGLSGAINGTSAVLDGELVGLDDQGRPRFELIQRHSVEVAFYAFDLLGLNDMPTISLAYEQRRALLADVLDQGSHWAVPAHRIGGGQALFDAAAEQQMEGVMAKRLGSTYQPGKRAPNWRKIKVRQRVSLPIGGFTPGSGNRSSTFGSLLVGVPTEGGLRFAGGIGSGFDHATLASLAAALGQLATPDCPFTTMPPRSYLPATWVQPGLVAEAEIAEFTNDGLVRHATFIGLTESPPPTLLP